MPSASGRAASQVALAPSLGPKGGGRTAAPFWSDLHPLILTVHWSWGNHCSLVTGCKAMHGWGPSVGPAWRLPCLPEKEIPTLVPCWNTSVFLLPFPTPEPLALLLVPQIFFSSCFSSFIFQLQCLLAFLRYYGLALHWQLLLINLCVHFINLVILSNPKPLKATLHLFPHVCKAAVP